MGGVVVEAQGVSFRHPADWRSEAVEGAAAVVVLPVGEGAFAPNVVLTIVDSTAPIEDASIAALAAAGDQHPKAVVIACDLWQPDTIYPGRRITFTYPAGDGAQVDVAKWVWATGRRHVHLSASSAPYQTPHLAETFLWIASTLQIAEEA